VKLRIVAVGALLGLAACASTSGPPSYTKEAWDAAVRERGLDPLQVIYPFAVTPRMEDWAREAMTRGTGVLGRLAQLQRGLFDDDEFPFRYVEELTLPASEAFRRMEGNCLSFTSLFVALARSQGFAVRLVEVERVLEASREEGLVVINRHVVAGYPHGGKLYIYDFYENAESRYIGYRIADDVTASALVHTNLGARWLLDEVYAEALNQFILATRLDPGLASAWVNLGVVRRRLGDREGAFEAYRKALEASPGNASALTNLARLYSLQGRHEEARLALLAAARGFSSPYSLVALARLEADRGHYRDARKYLSRARSKGPSIPEVWEAMGDMAEAAGEPDRALRYRARALRLRRALEDEEVAEALETAPRR